MSEVVTVYTECYTKYVLEKLIDIKGKSTSDVANFILKEWIADHREELEQNEITVKDAKRKGIIKK